jgi:hypothetical protein
MMLTTPLEVFLVGLGGGALLELIHWYALRRDERLPAYARNPFYWLVSIAMAVAGGLLAWVYFGGRAEAVIALHVGLSTPLILQKLATTIADTPGGKGGGRGIISFLKW